MMIGLDRLAKLPCLPGIEMTIPHKHVVIITLVLRSRHTNIRIDIRELEGGVKATSVLCLLGIGVGLGSLFLYRIFTRLFPPALPPPPLPSPGLKRPTSGSKRCARCGRLEVGSPLHKRRTVAAGAEKISGLTKGDTLSPQSDQGYCTEGGIDSGHQRSPTELPVSITPDSPSTVIGGLADISVSARQRRPSQDSVVTRAQSWESDDEEQDRLPMLKRYRADSSVVSEPTDISRPSTNRNSMYSSYSSSDLGFFSSGAALDSFDAHQHGFGRSQSATPQLRSRAQMSNRANLDLALGSSATSPVHSHGSGPSTVMGSPLMRRHNHQRNISSSSLTESNLRAHSGASFQLGEPDELCQCGSGASGMSDSYADFDNMEPSIHSSPTMHANSINNNGLDQVDAADSNYYTEGTDDVFIRRNPYSFYSECGASSEISMKEYLLHHYSVDLEDDLSGMNTPDSETLEGGDEFGLKTVANIEKIQYELQSIQQDMDDMSNDVYKLNSRDDLNDEQEENSQLRWKSASDCAVNRRSYKRRRSRSRSNSNSHSRSGSADSFYSDSYLENSQGRKESNSFGDYMWDYQSDLLAGAAHGRVAETFVAKRPCFRPVPSRSTTISSNLDSSPSHSNHGSSCDSKVTGGSRAGSGRSSQNSRPQSWETTSCSWMVENVGRKYNLFEYAEKYWSTSCCDAKAMKKGLQRIPNLLGLSHVRPVRRDHYCLLRAVLYQVLVNRLPIHPYLASWKHVQKRLEALQQRQPYYLQKWTFANRLPYRRDQLYEHAVECVQCLYEQMSVLGDIEDSASRENQLLQHLNAHPQLDLMLLEGCKLLMLLHALKLHEDLQAGRPTTLFARLLFSTEGATTPELLLKNYLNPLGDTLNMQRLHLYLLGHTLGVKIQVIQPSSLSCNDFVAHYPDDGADCYPKIYLLQEEDGHYDVLSP